MNNLDLIYGDCLYEMAKLSEKSVDMILCDLPYGATEATWDKVIPASELWIQYNRIIKDGGAIVLTATQPFTSKLINSNIDKFCYTWVWDKKFAGNYSQAKRMPMRTFEDIVVFSKSGKMPRYFPIMIPRDKPIKAGGQKGNEAFPNRSSAEAKQKQKDKTYTEKYPTSILEFNVRDDRGFHPTQKPVALMEYLIKTYTIEGGTVLDNCMGSGSTGVACKNTGRNFIGIEKDQKYFEIAKKRIEENINGKH